MEGDNEVQELCLSLKNSAIDVGVGVPDVPDGLLAGTYIATYGLYTKEEVQYEEVFVVLGMHAQ